MNATHSPSRFPSVHSGQPAGASDPLGTLPLDDATRAAVRQAAVPVRLRRGDVISGPNSHSQLLLVSSGLVRLFRPAPEGKQLTVALVGRGDSIGAESVLSGRHAYLAQVVEHGTGHMVPGEVLARLAAHSPGMRQLLADAVVDRLNATLELATQLAYRTIDERMAWILLELDKRMGHPTLNGGRVLNARVPRASIALMIGTTRSRASQSLSKLQDAGAVATREGRLMILDRARLEQLAGVAESTDGMLTATIHQPKSA